jgi:hypothetical protein
MGRVIILIGEPAVGKSFIMHKILAEGEWRFDSTIKYIPCHWQSPNRCIIGRYDDATHPFPGTDRMSMACQPHVINFILQNPEVTFLFEGDRLGNDKMIKALQHMGREIHMLHIVTNLDRRRPSQSNAFRMSRRTKIRNMIGPSGRSRRTGQPIQTFINDTPDDAAFIVDAIKDML